MKAKALIPLIAKGSGSKVAQLIPTIEDINYQQTEGVVKGFTLLHYACVNKKKEVVAAILVLEDVNVNQTDHAGFTSLHTACNLNARECILLLLKDPRVKKDGKTNGMFGATAHDLFADYGEPEDYEYHESYISRWRTRF